jgi:hypothetical protein
MFIICFLGYTREIPDRRSPRGRATDRSGDRPQRRAIVAATDDRHGGE